MVKLRKSDIKAGRAKYPKNPSKAMKYAWTVRRGKKIKPTTTKKRRGGKTVSTRRKSLRMPTLFKFARLISLVGPFYFVGTYPWNAPGGSRQKIANAVEAYTGYNFYENAFRLSSIKYGWLPFIGTHVMSTLVMKMNSIIRRL